MAGRTLKASLFAAAAALGLDASQAEAQSDVVNLFDKQYEIRNGTGVGVGEPEWGARRGSSSACRRSSESP